MICCKTKKHYRAAQKDAPAQNHEPVTQEPPDFWAEHGPLLILILSALALAFDLVALGARLAKMKADALEMKAYR